MSPKPDVCAGPWNTQDQFMRAAYKVCQDSFYNPCTGECFNWTLGFRADNFKANWVEPHAGIIYGILYPILLFATIVANICVVLVLTRKHMRTPTNTVLLYMAIADLFVALVPFPFLLWYFMLDHRLTLEQDISNLWCYLGHYSANDVVPPICHNVAIWLTVLLAAQRFIYVRFPLRAGRICTIRNVNIATACIIVMAFAQAFPRFIDIQAYQVLNYRLHANTSQSTRWEVYPRDDDNAMMNSGQLLSPSFSDSLASSGLSQAPTFQGVQVSSPMIATGQPHTPVLMSAQFCIYRYTSVVMAVKENNYFSLYYWIRVILFVLIPSGALIILTTALVAELRAAKRRRCRLTMSHQQRQRNLNMSVTATGQSLHSAAQTPNVANKKPQTEVPLLDHSSNSILQPQVHQPHLTPISINRNVNAGYESTNHSHSSDLAEKTVQNCNCIGKDDNETNSKDNNAYNNETHENNFDNGQQSSDGHGETQNNEQENPTCNNSYGNSCEGIQSITADVDEDAYQFNRRNTHNYDIEDHNDINPCDNNNNIRSQDSSAIIKSVSYNEIDNTANTHETNSDNDISKNNYKESHTHHSSTTLNRINKSITSPTDTDSYEDVTIRSRVTPSDPTVTFLLNSSSQPGGASPVSQNDYSLSSDKQLPNIVLSPPLAQKHREVTYAEDQLSVNTNPPTTIHSTATTPAASPSPGGQHQHSSASQRDHTTLMLIIIVIVFLVVNLPQGLILAMFIVQQTFLDTFGAFLSPRPMAIAMMIDNVLILATYPLNFAIYCWMSAAFRDTFRTLFCGGHRRAGELMTSLRQSSVYHSLNPTGRIKFTRTTGFGKGTTVEEKPQHVNGVNGHENPDLTKLLVHTENKNVSNASTDC